MNGQKECPICDRQLKVGNYQSHQAHYWYWCDVCGRFNLGVNLARQWEHYKSSEFSGDLHLIQGHIRERLDRWQDMAEDPDDPIFASADDVKMAIEQAPHTVVDKSDKLLSAAVRRTQWFGQEISFDPRNDAPLAYAKNKEELLAILKLLVESGFVGPVRSGSASEPYTTCVTATGFERDRVRAESNAESDTAFVAMWFGSEMSAAYDSAIAPALRRCGYMAKRVDLEQHNDDVIDKMLALIRDSRFVVADFTGHRNGVYFEAGFAMGLGIPVVWTCKKQDMNKSHFDTNHFSHVLWSDGNELANKLESRILATIGRGPLRQP